VGFGDVMFSDSYKVW